MKTFVTFRSDAFPAVDGEDEEINPGRFGKRLAEFLASSLRAHGFEPDELIAEDWGWIVPLENESFPLWIGCGNYEEHADGFLCFIEPHEPTVRRFFKKIDTRERVESLHRAVDEVLSGHTGIRDKRWWTHAEFHAPSAPDGPSEGTNRIE